MSVETKELMAEIRKTKEILANIFDLYKSKIEWICMGEKSIEKAVLLADIFVKYYTCSETLFFRISQFFENSLPKEKWRAELLRKINLSIPEVREQVISDKAYAMFDEFRKFRHFKRYYFSMDYDWDRLEYLRKNSMNSTLIF